MKRGPYRIHPARLALGAHGFTASALAQQAGVSPGSITRQLSGEVTLSERVRAALVELIGEAGAADVIAAIPPREKAAA
jgi:transcriptional regulator with XRE-family HTH domain